MRTLLILALLLSPIVQAFDAGRAAFAVRINDDTIPYRVFGVYVLPGESLDLAVPGANSAADATTDMKGLTRVGPAAWRGVAPAEPGNHKLRIRYAGDDILLNVIVMHPANAVIDGQLNGFRIGAYKKRPYKGDPIYLPPDGYIELTEANAGLQISPHFTLGQFPAKQAGGYPKYLVLREHLLLRLELLLEHINAQGIATDTFTVMSGYRTPYYNASIGNVAASRHIFGGAADIFVDVSPADGRMDDLNGDNIINYRDAQLLYRWANELFARPEHAGLSGGLGVYKSTSAHGPFLHVDARGKRARWGLLP